MKARLNLATAPLEGNRRFAVGAATAAVVGLAALFLLGQRAYQVWRADTNFRAEQADIEADMNRLRGERQELAQFFSRPDTVQRQDLSAFLNSLIAQRAFPWTRIFMDFESSLPAGVRIVSIEPRLVDNYVQLRLTIGASDDVSKLEFLRRLEKSAAFSRIQVEGERRSDVTTGNPGEIVMVLQARYSTS
jgi:hypothetical protein